MKVDMGFCLVDQPRPIETAHRFSMARPKSLRPTLAVTFDRSLKLTTYDKSLKQNDETK